MFKVLKDFYHLTDLYVEGDVKEVRADLVAGLKKEGFIEKAKPAEIAAAAEVVAVEPVVAAPPAVPTVVNPDVAPTVVFA